VAEENADGSVAGSEEYFSTSQFSADTERPSLDASLPDEPMDVEVSFF
jgi:hypothetical protein